MTYKCIFKAAAFGYFAFSCIEAFHGDINQAKLSTIIAGIMLLLAERRGA